MVANHGGSPSGRLTAVGGLVSPDLVVGRALDAALLRGVVFFGSGADAFLFVGPAFAGVFLAVAVWDVGIPRLPGRLLLLGSVGGLGSAVIGSLALRGISMAGGSSSSSDAARERG